MDIRFPLRRFVTVAAALLLQAGCVTTQSREPTGPQDFASSNLPPGQPVTPDELLGTDPSAVRLEDIGGDFLLYMRINGHMPAGLEDLRSVDDQGGAAMFISPNSGQPYVYVPGGLWLSGHSNNIVVYDPELTKKGMRWCLFLGPQRANGTFSVDVVALPESVFRQYKPASSSPESNH
jgi:hypothetical protein